MRPHHILAKHALIGEHRDRISLLAAPQLLALLWGSAKKKPIVQVGVGEMFWPHPAKDGGIVVVPVARVASVEEVR